MKHFLLRAAPLLFVCACTPPLPPPPITTAPPPAASSASVPAPAPVVDASLVSITAARRPPTVVLDGDITEWGSLLPSSLPAPPPEPDNTPPFVSTGEPGEPGPPPEKPLPSGPNPASATSHLALALGNDAVTIAADLGEPARDGFWLGIGEVPPPVPSIGLIARAGYIVPFNCDFEQIRLMEGEWKKGPAKPPEVVAACRGVLARHAELIARHRARFTRLFKIDRDGVHGSSADGTLSTIDGAKAVFKPGARGATVEVSLPLTAMPRLAEAPAVTLRLVARAATGPKPDVSVFRPWLAVFKSGKFLEEAAVPGTDSDLSWVVDAFSAPELHGVVKRDGELHAFSYGAMSINYVGVIRWPSWSVIAIAADGSVRNVVEDANVPMMSGGETTGFISLDHSSFGVRGPAENVERGNGQPQMVGLDVTWRWDAAKKKYVGKRRRFPLPAVHSPGVVGRPRIRS